HFVRPSVIQWFSCFGFEMLSRPKLNLCGKTPGMADAGPPSAPNLAAGQRHWPLARAIFLVPFSTGSLL
ncbi:MAG: hypothetical protein QOG75_6394, partial [Mycobacterium sp.]|nr:hypothetical protein [Mycobacterium sp.]